MDIETVLEQLRIAKSGSRYLDGLIAQWRRWRLTPLELSASTKEDAARTQKVWLTESNEVVKVPLYTTSLQAAYELALDIAGSSEGGLCYDEQQSRAQVGLDTAPFFAPTQALALCIATLEFSRRRANFRN